MTSNSRGSSVPDDTSRATSRGTTCTSPRSSVLRRNVTCARPDAGRTLTRGPFSTTRSPVSSVTVLVSAATGPAPDSPRACGTPDPPSTSVPAAAVATASKPATRTRALSWLIHPPTRARQHLTGCRSTQW
ncbi:hypothetical protein [Actinophytocola sp.]|uniref:hypothetical protein n=1 Tax=Actinophytocola sp. TaxID=1872138 RepID=UPI003D6A1FD6